MPWKRYPATPFAQSLMVEYHWIHDELVRIYSNGTNQCARCGTLERPEIHHIDGTGDQYRLKWQIGTDTPRKMAYLYEMYFHQEEFKGKIGILCSKCNKLEKIERRGETRRTF